MSPPAEHPRFKPLSPAASPTALAHRRAWTDLTTDPPEESWVVTLVEAGIDLGFYARVRRLAEHAIASQGWLADTRDLQQPGTFGSYLTQEQVVAARILLTARRLAAGGTTPEAIETWMTVLASDTDYQRGCNLHYELDLWTGAPREWPMADLGAPGALAYMAGLSPAEAQERHHGVTSMPDQTLRSMAALRGYRIPEGV